MKKRFLFFSAVSLALVACGGFPAPAPSSTPPPTFTPKPPPTLSAPQTVAPLTPVCRSSAEPTEEDIDRALNFAGNVFPSAEWKRSYTVMESRAAVSWTSENKLAYLEALIFPCGYEEANLDAYYNAETWAVIFSNYDGYQPAADCRADSGLRLYEFSAKNSDFKYDVRYWVQNDAQERVLTLMLVFPFEERARLEAYAARLFPNLPHCP